MKYEDLTKAVGSVVVTYAILRVASGITGGVYRGVKSSVKTIKAYNKVLRSLKERKEIEIDGKIYRFVDYQGERTWYEVKEDQPTEEG